MMKNKMFRLMKSKMFKDLMCMNPYQYNIDELNQAVRTLAFGYYTFNLYDRNVVYVHGKFSFVDNRGIGNLELWYIDPMVDETVAQCVTFQAVDANRCFVIYDFKKPGHAQGITIFDDNDKIDLHIRFTQVDACNESVITPTVRRTLMNTIRLVGVDTHFGRSLSLINNMLPFASITTNRAFQVYYNDINETVYKLVPKLKFTYDNFYNGQVTFIIGFVELDTNHDYSSFEMAEKIFRDHGDYEVDTDEIDEKYLENLIVGPKDIYIIADDEEVLEIHYSDSKEDTERRITKDEVKASVKLFKHGGRAAKANTSNDKRTGVVKITTLDVIAMVGAGPLTIKNREEAYVNVSDCRLSEGMLRIDALVGGLVRSHILNFKNCALLETDKDDSGFKSTLLDFDEKKIYKVTYSK